MKEITRTYFKLMLEVGTAYAKAKAERDAEKEALMNADKWDEVAAWHEREKQFTNPHTSGQYKAYWAYRNSAENESEDIDMRESLWDREVKDFSDTLKAAGVTTFVITNQSTGLMEDIHNLEAQGWRLAGACKLRTKVYRFGSERIEETMGLRFEINEEV